MNFTSYRDYISSNLNFIQSTTTPNEFTNSCIQKKIILIDRPPQDHFIRFHAFEAAQTSLKLKNIKLLHHIISNVSFIKVEKCERFGLLLDIIKYVYHSKTGYVKIEDELYAYHSIKKLIPLVGIKIKNCYKFPKASNPLEDAIRTGNVALISLILRNLFVIETIPSINEIGEKFSQTEIDSFYSATKNLTFLMNLKTSLIKHNLLAIGVDNPCSQIPNDIVNLIIDYGNGFCLGKDISRNKHGFPIDSNGLIHMEEDCSNYISPYLDEALDRRFYITYLINTENTEFSYELTDLILEYAGNYDAVEF